ncbi:MAG: MFS transporter [Bacteroidetes bacterium]|nr:MFS transporter [Bacteroidota bacterium]
MNQPTAKTNLLITVAALGYFVDIYDLIVFNVVKNASLTDLGISGKALKEAEIRLFNLQMAGMLLGGILWGILGDKRGRVSVLFGSIFLYSAANIVNAFVTDTFQYGITRFIAGIGLAGELGAGITLVAENMEREKRGYGTMIIVTFGALGAVVAGLIGKAFSWQVTYIVGGCMGLALLLMRAGAYESGMYTRLKEQDQIKRGNMLSLFTKRQLLFKYVACILIGLPIWFTIGVLVNLSNRFGEFFGLTESVNVADSVMFAYLGLSTGDLISGLLSQWLRSRKKVVLIYLGLTFVLFIVYLFNTQVSIPYFKFMAFALGFATGYWALFVTIASEQFGTNIRSTVTNTVPNFVRGAVVPITLSFAALSEQMPITNAALVVGMVCLILAFISTLFIKESFSKDLNYFEID